MGATPAARPGPRHWSSTLSMVLFPAALWIVLPLWGTHALLITFVILAGAQWLAGEHRWRWALVVLTLLALLAGGQAELGVRLYPVMINLSLALLFLGSLRTTPLIERLARLSEPDLPLEGVRYTRRVTWMWGIFMSFNTVVALVLALHAPLHAWQTWTGALSYALAALLMSGEWLVRQRVRRRAVNA
ncbi:putative membrane protein [Kushneria indalinina DSM 14324]|uniref:Putative membrane protein n=2 Tax=Kushneria indalinina TaxID=184067 RepID=A0A3D9DTU1_9GAMM|nr:putative membrane protein [Kushneria indalinina DSM 14324]